MALDWVNGFCPLIRCLIVGYYPKIKNGGVCSKINFLPKMYVIQFLMNALNLRFSAFVTTSV